MKSLYDMFKEREEYVTAPEEEKRDSVDWDTIAKLEGGIAEKAYVPKSGKSGVTIGAGLDLGQRNTLDDLKGLTPELKSKLEPFLGLKRDEAERALASMGGFFVSPEEAKKLSDAAKEDTMSKLRKQWAESSDVPFEKLTPAQQTVLASIMHQYGNLNRTPRFKKFATAGDWESVLKELRDFKDKYKTRRNKEADILEQDLMKIARNYIK